MKDMAILLALIAVGFILLIAEYLARYTSMHSELTRKFVHMCVGTFVAFWPFFLSWREIELLSIAFLIVILISIRITAFKAIHTSPSRAIGEICFAVVIGLLALISTTKWIFMASMLSLSIGDALAAIVGVMWGESTKYKVFGKTKSVIGTATFFVVSVGIMMTYVHFSPDTAGFTTLFLVPVLATLTENVAFNGTDNLIMPLLIALVLGGAA